MVSEGRDEFNLVVIGHSIPREDKQALVKVSRMFSQAAVLSTVRPTSVPLAEADYSVGSADGPEALIAAVNKASARDRLKVTFGGRHKIVQRGLSKT